MSIAHEVLGRPGADNALYVTVADGQSRSRLLFDCGQGVLDTVNFAEIAKIEALFFSHFHFDHFAGFDSFFRNNWCRAETPVRIFGPAGTCQVIHHRLQGFLWNNAVGLPGEFLVSEFDGQVIRTIRLLTTDQFSTAHCVAETNSDVESGTAVIYQTERFQVSCCVMDHGTDSLAFIVREQSSANMDATRMESLGLSPGPWIRKLKESTQSDETLLTIADRSYSIKDLRDQLLTIHQGDSIAYLTDFTLSNPDEESRLISMLTGCRTLVCENNYLDTEAEQAKKNRHMTTSEVGRLARQINPEQLVLFHLSDRYHPEQWMEQLSEMRKSFPATTFPSHWKLCAE